MAKYRGDAGLLREAVAYAGLDLYDDKVFSDGNNGTRRLKLWRCPELFDATPAVQKKFMERLKHNFGNRVIKYHSWISSRPYNFQSFVLVITEDTALQQARKEAYAATIQARANRLHRERMDKHAARIAEEETPVVVTIEDEWVPTQDHVEFMYLKGYQEARAGEGTHYGPGVNHDLWEKGATAFRDGKQLFA